MRCFNGKHGSVQKLFCYLFLECDKNQHMRMCWSYRSITRFLKAQEWLFPLSKCERQTVLWFQSTGGTEVGLLEGEALRAGWPLPGSGKCRTPRHPHFTCSTNCPQPIFNLGVAAKTPRPSPGSQSLVCLLCGWGVCCGVFCFVCLALFRRCSGLALVWVLDNVQLADLSAVPSSFFLLGS